MKKSYLLLYGSSLGSPEQVRDWVDSIDIITDWRTRLPHCMFLISESSAEDIYKELTKKAGEKGTFLIVEYSKNSQGRLDGETWHLLEHKKRKPKTD